VDSERLKMMMIYVYVFQTHSHTVGLIGAKLCTGTL
jgi:hypothetical protein